MKNFGVCLTVLLLLPLYCATGLAESIHRQEFARFSDNDLKGWEEKSFVGHTRYKLVTSDNRTVLEANTQGAASVLYKKMVVDLTKTPWIHWSWKISNTYEGLNEQSKAGDDYPARIYVVYKKGILPWNTRALNYVWSSSMPRLQSWDNAYTKKARMIAIRSGSENTGKWMQEKRNLREDYFKQFGEYIDRIDGVAIMADSDDSGMQATGYFGDIYFTDR